jgi:hypothetical protein
LAQKFSLVRLRLCRREASCGGKAEPDWIIRRLLRDGWKAEAAEEEARKVGLKETPYLNEFAHRYIERHQK